MAPPTHPTTQCLFAHQLLPVIHFSPEQNCDYHPVILKLFLFHFFCRPRLPSLSPECSSPLLSFPLLSSSPPLILPPPPPLPASSSLFPALSSITSAGSSLSHRSRLPPSPSLQLSLLHNFSPLISTSHTDCWVAVSLSLKAWDVVMVVVVVVVVALPGHLCSYYMRKKCVLGVEGT